MKQPPQVSFRPEHKDSSRYLLVCKHGVFMDNERRSLIPLGKDAPTARRTVRELTLLESV